MPDLKELKQAMDSTRSAYSRLNNERDERKRGLLAVEERRIAADLEAEYGARLSEADTAAHDAHLAYYAALESHVKSGAGAPLPIGTRLVNWGGAGYSSYQDPVVRTGLVGVVEAVTRESRHGKKASYSQADIGSFIVRHLKKDGTTGTRYDKFGGWGESLNSYDHAKLPHGWYPEGVDPNVKTVGGER